MRDGPEPANRRMTKARGERLGVVLSTVVSAASAEQIDDDRIRRQEFHRIEQDVGRLRRTQPPGKGDAQAVRRRTSLPGEPGE